jgi:hypothetical protein
MTLKDNYLNKKTEYKQAAKEIFDIKEIIINEYELQHLISDKCLSGIKTASISQYFIEKAISKLIADDLEKILITASTLCLADIGEDNGAH